MTKPPANALYYRGAKISALLESREGLAWYCGEGDCDSANVEYLIEHGDPGLRPATERAIDLHLASAHGISNTRQRRVICCGEPWSLAEFNIHNARHA